MAFVRCIGRWTMTALVINCIVGGGIFGFPAELTRLLGAASPIAMIVGALGMAVIMACIAEVASQFSEAGGPYLYVRTAFGRFMGMQVGWFHLLAVIGAMAALATVFVDYLSTFVPWATHAWPRSAILAILIAIPAAANYAGARSGANLSTAFAVVKLAPLALLIFFGVARFAAQPVATPLDIATPGLGKWISAMGLLVFAFGGWEDALIPTGEISEPRRTIPFGAGTGLLASSAIYALLQFITVVTIGMKVTDRPLADVGSALLGRGGAEFVAAAAMISTYGWISAHMLNAPRLVYALSAQRDFPAAFATLHPEHHTPAAAILLYAFTGWILASSGTFLWIATLSAGAMMVYYLATCAALIRLRKIRPNVDALRIPFGPALSILGIAICIALMTGLTGRQVLLMGLIALVAAANWLWASRRTATPTYRVTAQG